MPKALPRALIAVIAAVICCTVSSRRAIAGTVCDGDCDGNGAVSIDELIVAVNIALGLESVRRCRGADRNGDQAVFVDELTAAVASSLSTCTPGAILVPGNRASCGCARVVCGDCPFGANCLGTPIELGCARACRVVTSLCQCIEPYRGTNFVEYIGGCGPNCEDLVDCGRGPRAEP